MAAAFAANEVMVANVGDCRAYWISPQETRRISVDHSLVGEQLRDGLITESEAATSPYRNLVTRGLGLDNDPPAVDLFGPYRFDEKSALLLCSDGLYTMATDDELAKAVLEESPQPACETLVRLANARGGPDNVSVIVVASK